MAEILKNGKIENIDIPEFAQKDENEEKGISLSRIEVENIKNAIKGEPEDGQRIMLSVFPTHLLKEELERREGIMDNIITQIKEFSGTIDSSEELEDKQKKFEEFRLAMAGLIKPAF